jgi:glycosyltransferase involved in cell wall biosynthesis
LEILSRRYDITCLATSGSRKDDHRYVAALEKLGVAVFVQSYSWRDILMRNRFNVALLEFYFVAESYLPRIRLSKPRCPVIIDSVDLHYARERLKYEITGNINDFKKALDTKKKELSIYEKADAVITVSEMDANVLKGDCPNLRVETIPNIHRLEISDNNRQENSLIFVGGFGHDPNVDAVLHLCRDILPLVKGRIPDVKLTIVGSHPPEEIKRLSNEYIAVTGYVPSTTPYLQRSYISVAPLRYGSGMKGKVGEAMAHGIPVVTTSIGAQGMNLINKQNAMIADGPEEFCNCIVELVQNRDLYRRIQNNSLEYIRKNLTPGAVEGKIFAFFDELENIVPKKLMLGEKVSFCCRHGLTWLGGRLFGNTRSCVD